MIERENDMQFIDLHRQYNVIENEVNERIKNVLSHKGFISGPEVEEFEEMIGNYTGRKHVIACASGTDALVLPLMAYNLKETDAVFVPSFTFFASAESITLAGGTPVFVDSDKETFNISIESLEKTIENVIKDGKLTPRGIVPVDLFGLPANFDEVERIAKKYNLFVLEDGAQGFGGELKGKKACSFGDVSATSFFPAKPLGCYGDGGAVFTDDDELYKKMKSIHVHGQGTDKYDNIQIGLNSRLDTIQAAILIEKLKIFPVELESRNKNAQLYIKYLKDYVDIPNVPEDYYSSWAQFTCKAKNMEERNKIIKDLAQIGIPVMVYYKVPVHNSTAYKGCKLYCDDFSNAVELSKTVFSLPMHPYLEENEIETICKSVVKVIK